MTYELKRISVWSVAKISFVIGAVFGLVIGFFIWMAAGLLGTLPLSDMPGEMGGGRFLGAMGAIAPFFLAVFYGVVSMIANAIMTAIYNVFSGFFGGIEVNLVAQAPPQSAPPAYGTQQAPPPAPPTTPPSPPSPESPPAPPTGA